MSRMTGGVLITGGAGFIGSHLCERLLPRGHVVCLDSFDGFYSESLKQQNLASIAEHPHFHLVQGDFREPAVLDRAFGLTSLRAVIHLGGRPGVRASFADPQLYNSVNVGGTIRVLEACQRHDVTRMLLASSSSVYGSSDRLPFREDDAADRPLSPYAASKRAAELMAHSMAEAGQLDVVALRFFTAFGPRQRPDMAIARFADRIEAGQPIPVFGDGQQKRDFTYVDDIINGVVAALDTPLPGYSLFNLGRGKAVTVSDVIDDLSDLIGEPAQIDRQPEQPGDARATLACIDAAREQLGYDPRVDIREGIERFLRWRHDQRSD